MSESARYSAGVYCCWNGQTPIYIGTSKSMYFRLCTHHRKVEILENGFDRITWIETPRSKEETIAESKVRLNMERWLIRRHKPRLNVRSNPGQAAVPESAYRAGI